MQVTDTDFDKPIIDYHLSRAYTQTWQAMEKLVDRGKTRMIGKT
jgi:alcohol dehydrogenase (NADP+)